MSDSIVESAPTRVASCVCGGFKLNISGDPIRITVCHCFACQQRTGSVMGVQARFHDHQVLETIGEFKEYTRTGDSGSVIVYKFCPTCGSTVSYSFTSCFQGFTMVPVGVLSDPNIGAPVFSVYEARMHPWIKLPPNIEHMD